MKAQDFYPYDWTIPGLNNICYAIVTDSHYINSPCVVAKNKIVPTGSTYLLSIVNYVPHITIAAVQLNDVYFDSVYILAVDEYTDW